MLYVNLQFANHFPLRCRSVSIGLVRILLRRKTGSKQNFVLASLSATLSRFLRASVLRLLVDYFRNQSVF